jgi:hypothetical protein
MNDYLLESYIERLSKEDVNAFALKQGITLEYQELDIIYTYLKQEWRTFYYGNPITLLAELKAKLKPITYQKIEALYIQAKNYLT